MRKILLLLFVSIAFFASAKVYTLYYGPDHNGQYLEFIIHGKKGISWYPRDSIPRYSHSRVEELLKEPSIWFVEFVKFNEADNTLIFHSTMYKPVQRRYIFSNDLSVLEIRDLRLYAALPTEKLPLVDIHIDPRAGKDDFLGSPKLRVRVLDPRDKCSNNKD